MENYKTTPEIIEFWNNSRLLITDKFETPPEIICVEDSLIGTLGNFSASTGKAKSKKTFNVCAIVAAALSGEKVLQYNVNLPLDKANILYVDTEQSTFHCSIIIERIFKLAQLPLDVHPQNIEFLALRKYSPKIRIQIIEEAIYNTNNLGLVIIDGIRDLAHDINSPSESTYLISKLMKWTEELNIHIHTVLHQNKGDNNSRGHLGTELNNKAETILQIEKNPNDPDVSEVSPVHIRAKEFQNFAFRINELSLPEIVDGYLTKKSYYKKGINFEDISDEDHRRALSEAFSEAAEMGYGELIEAIMVGYNTVGYVFGKNKAKDFKKLIVDKKMILHEASSYKLNPNY